MSEQDFAIYQRLRNNPGTMHVEKTKLYHLQGDRMYVLTGDFAGKTKEELNQIICVAVGH